MPYTGLVQMPGINMYVPTADLNLRAQKKIKGGKKNSMKERTNLQTTASKITVDFILDDIRRVAIKELQSGKTTMTNKIAKLVGQSVELKKTWGRTSQVIIKNKGGQYMLSMLIESIKEKLGELSSWSGGGFYWNRNTNFTW